MFIITNSNNYKFILPNNSLIIINYYNYLNNNLIIN